MTYQHGRILGPRRFVHDGQKREGAGGCGSGRWERIYRFLDEIMLDIN